MASTSQPNDALADPAHFDPMWAAAPAAETDWRHIATGRPLPTKFYADQPYLTPTRDGGLLCVVTTGTGHEGARGQHVLAMKTFDGGKTWRDVVPVEDPAGPESSWGVPITLPDGRVFVFYVFNQDDLRELPADDPPYPGGTTRRMDSHGYYVFRWSDDHGKTWSKERGVIPVREFAIDRNNATGGKVRLFWNVGRAFVSNGSLFLPIHKVGGFGEGWFTRSEGGLLRSDDFLSAADPLEATWETLPRGDSGIQAPAGGGPIAEEHSFVALGDGTFFCVFRTIDGHPACAYSRDGGATWEPSQSMRFAEGRPMKHPRAANFVWKLADGGYLYCFHNHGGKCLGEHPARRTLGYSSRNPLWVCRGWESGRDGEKVLLWSEPELLLYDDDPMVRISYPDCLERDGRLIVTETQKAVARVHEVPPHLAEALSACPAIRGRSLGETRPLLDWTRKNAPETVRMPSLPAFVARDEKPPYGGKRTRKGFSVHLALRVETGKPSVLVRNEGRDGSGWGIEWTEDRTVRIWLNDGNCRAGWESDPLPPGPIRSQITVNVDGGSNTLCFYRDGAFQDGADRRQFGWGRIHPGFRNEYAGRELAFPDGEGAAAEAVRIYGRVLTSAEVQILAGREAVPRAEAARGRKKASRPLVGR